MRYNKQTIAPAESKLHLTRQNKNRWYSFQALQRQLLLDGTLGLIHEMQQWGDAGSCEDDSSHEFTAVRSGGTETLLLDSCGRWKLSGARTDGYVMLNLVFRTLRKQRRRLRVKIKRLFLLNVIGQCFKRRGAVLTTAVSLPEHTKYHNVTFVPSVRPLLGFGAHHSVM